MTQILAIHASASGPNSVTDTLLDHIITHFTEKDPKTKVSHRHLLASEIPFLHPELVGAYFTPEADRSEEQRKTLTHSDAYVDELLSADTVVLGAPMYNFGIPGILKAYFDLIARAGRTFEYTKDGPKGLLSGKKAVIAVATGGTPLGSPYDFVTPYVTQFLNFLGISDLSFITIDQRGDKEALMAQADKDILQL